MLLQDPFDFHARSRGEYIFAISEDGECTYAQARERSLRIASALLDLGLAPGERVGIIMSNSLDTLLIIYAGARAGLVCVPVNCRLAPREWIGMIDDANARAVFADSVFCEALETAGGKPPIAVCSQGARPGWLALDELIAAASSKLPSIVPSAESAILQLYTSGTTGKPKGAVLSHRSVLADISQLSFALGNCVPGQRSLHVLQFFHVAGLGFALRASSGGETLVIARQFDPFSLLQTLVRERIAWMMVVPAIIQVLLKQPGIDGMAFPDLRYIVYGASPISVQTLVSAMQTFKCGFVQGFGMTELSCAGTILTEADHARAIADRPDLLSSAGRPLPGTEVRAVNADGSDCEGGEIGEILVRGPQVFSGYWQMPEATEAALRDGWLHTGDAGFVDKEGYLFVRDRIKDMIVSGGENVYPAEVEAVLRMHPDVADVTVIGVPDAKWGETVMAVVVPENGRSPTEADLDQHCRANLGGFKVPRRYSFVAALPRNASGKVLKRELRAPYWLGSRRQIG